MHVFHLGADSKMHNSVPTQKVQPVKLKKIFNYKPYWKKGKTTRKLIFNFIEEMFSVIAMQDFLAHLSKLYDNKSS